MGLKYVLDTDICIYIMNKTHDSVFKHLNKTSSGEVAMSIITYGELLNGANKSDFHQRAIQKLALLTEIIPPLSLPVEVVQHYGKIRSLLEKKGKIIGGNDLWIAAHALSLDVTLVTNNGKEFKRIAALKVENWC